MRAAATSAMEPVAGASPQSGRKRILLSAYACSPLWGSEPGVGWRWLLELLSQHDVTLVTHAFFESHLKPEFDRRGAVLSVVYVDAPTFGMAAERYLNSRAYYVWWQFRLRRIVAALLVGRDFDVVHHLTWGTFRFPCFLGSLGVPLVMGPLGGGECAPMRLMRSLPVRARLFEAVRTLALKTARFDPLATWGPKRSALVLCRTSETLAALPSRLRNRTGLAGDVGAPEIDISAARPRRRDGAATPLRLLFAGRLIGWKGVALALGAIALLRDRGIDLRLDIAGDGGLRPFLEAKAKRLGLDGVVAFLGAIQRDDLLRRYPDADLFVFPSLHDAGGSVVLEALSRGLPVVCLDLGGPKYYVDSSCGVVVATGALTEAEVERALADAIGGLVCDPGRLHALRDGAVARARRFTWGHQVASAYAQIGAALGWDAVAQRAS